LSKKYKAVVFPLTILEFYADLGSPRTSTVLQFCKLTTAIFLHQKEIFIYFTFCRERGKIGGFKY
jgi:hypothetical protein